MGWARNLNISESEARGFGAFLLERLFAVHSRMNRRFLCASHDDEKGSKGEFRKYSSPLRAEENVNI